MPDGQALVNDFVNKLRKRQIEGSQATAKHTAEFLRSVISQQRIPHTNQAAALIEAVKAVGAQLIAANPVGSLSGNQLKWQENPYFLKEKKDQHFKLAVGNVVRRILHIIRDEDLSLTTAAIGGLSLSAESDEDDVDNKNENPALCLLLQ